MRARRGSWLRYPIALLLIGAVVGLGIANYEFAQRSPGVNDYLPRWVAARAWVIEGLSPYDPQVTEEAQRMIYGRAAQPQAGEDLAHFAYPFPAMIFFAPLGALPYPLARAIWMTLLEISLPALLLMGLRIARWQPPTWLAACLLGYSVLWYHGVRSVMLGQFAAFEALMIMGALLAIEARQDIVAGILLALSIAKPQMAFLIIPLVLLWALSNRRWALMAWTMGGIVLLVSVSVALLPSWPLNWLQQLVGIFKYVQIESPLAIAAGWFPVIAEDLTWLLTGSLLLYTLWEWALAMRKPVRWLQWTAALTIVVTNLVAFRTVSSNFVIMLPALVLVFSVWGKRWGSRGNMAVLGMLVLLGVGIWALFLTTVSGNQEGAAVFLPVPFLTLVGLWWIRWWSLKALELPLMKEERL